MRLTFFNNHYKLLCELSRCHEELNLISDYKIELEKLLMNLKYKCFDGCIGIDFDQYGLLLVIKMADYTLLLYYFEIELEDN